MEQATFPLLPIFGCVSFFLASLGVFENIDLCVVKHVEFKCEKTTKN
jgi:hypothetical protein